ncbi:MAG TPA: cytotoxic translational repressor of toxin-antitoxin stability system [bacterium]|nr:cytotoxic translational repressor of toxin-antitoxin stability system [bacterium]HQO35112.1 cytotoxic translational repressor of toxin-antitoxin stability system [bacterium]HQQ00301.1 cytotoxic translational repressor of toxin-antitoxin stability system [bacterium]
MEEKNWTVTISTKLMKRARRLPRRVLDSLDLLVKEIRSYGPVRGNWPNYGKLNVTRHHCHLCKGKPTYVAVWEVRNKNVRLVEVIYVGTHEAAPY